MRNALIVLGVVVLVAAAFWGGTMYANANSSGSTAEFTPGDGVPEGGPGGRAGGPMADLTEEQMAEMQNMSAEERQAYLAEQGIEAPTGGAGATRGGQLEGEVLDSASDSLTISLDGGSQTVYLDENTVVAYAEGTADLAAGADVIVLSDPSSDGVTLATVVVVK